MLQNKDKIKTFLEKLKAEIVTNRLVLPKTK